MPRVLRAVIAGLVLACLGSFVPAAAPGVPPLAGLAPVARAAADELEITTAARYVVDPGADKVRVTVDITAVNNKAPLVRGGTVTRYFYDGVNLGVQPEAVRLRATQDGGPIRLRATRRDGYRLVTVRFASQLYFQQRATIRLAYDLPAGAPRSDSDVRVGKAFATFTAWAFGDTATVRVEVPARYRVEIAGGPLARDPGAGDAQAFTASTDDPIAWHASISATDDAALTRDGLTLSGGERVVIRGWPEDRRWLARVRSLLREGVPELVDRIGLDWPVDGPLTVTEVHTPLLEGYAGFYDPASDEITISEDLDDLTIVHEASHAWFNAGLFTDRWITEGLADEYAARVVRTLGGPLEGPEPPTRKAKAAFALETWGPPAPIRDDAAQKHEAYGYRASWWVMRRFVQKVGETRMRDVFRAAHDGTIAYRGEGTPERTRAANDWRRLLDLAEELGTPAGLDNLIETWVLDAPDKRLLAARTAARHAYGDLTHQGATWAAPVIVRTAMDGWSFGAATEAMDAAATVLDRRDAVAGLAADEGLVPPAGSEARYQDADTVGELAVLGDELGTSYRVLGDLAATATVVEAPRDWLTDLGLGGASPDADLDAARDAWEAGDLELARTDAGRAADALRTAPEAGRSKATLIGGAGVATLLVLLAVLAIVVRRRRRRAARTLAPRLATSPAAPWPYATLPDHAAPAEPTADPAPGDEGVPRT